MRADSPRTRWFVLYRFKNKGLQVPIGPERSWYMKTNTGTRVLGAFAVAQRKRAGRNAAGSFLNNWLDLKIA